MATSPSSPSARVDDRRAVGAALRRWAGAAGADDVPVVRLLDRHGFGTTEAGQLLALAGDSPVGRLALGALDDAARQLLGDLNGPGPLTRSAHVAENDAVSVGLACSGGATLLAHRVDGDQARALGQALERGMPAALVSPVDRPGALVLTGRALEAASGSLAGPDLDEAAASHARSLLRSGATATSRFTAHGVELLVDVWVPVPDVLLVGAGAIGAALVAQAGLLGWTSRTVTGLAPAQAALEGFGDADVLLLLDHDPAFDALLVQAVRAGRGFVGALGSRHTQAERRDRLRTAGLSQEELAAVHGPVGLDLGARTPAETAVSVVAQVIAVRAGRSASALTSTHGRISG